MIRPRLQPATTSSAAPPAVGRRERNKLEKRDRILAAARDLFASKGFASTTTAEIADRADVAAGTLFLYAASKEDLLVQVFREEMDRVADEAFAMLPARASLLDQMLHVYSALIALHDRDRSLARAFVKELLFVGGDNRDRVRAFVGKLIDGTAACIEGAQRGGSFDRGVPARDIAENCFCLYIAMLQDWLGLAGDVERGEHLARLRGALDLQLRGFQVR